MPHLGADGRGGAKPLYAQMPYRAEGHPEQPQSITPTTRTERISEPFVRKRFDCCRMTTLVKLVATVPLCDFGLRMVRASVRPSSPQLANRGRDELTPPVSVLAALL
jgi:hypothetical protein